MDSALLARDKEADNSGNSEDRPAPVRERVPSPWIGWEVAEEVRLGADKSRGLWETTGERHTGEHQARCKFMFRAQREATVGCHGKVPSRSKGGSEELIGKRGSQSKRKQKDHAQWFWLKQMGHCTKGEV